MSAGLQDLLDRIREHPAFRELLGAVEPPPLKGFKPSGTADDQTANWIFTSGRRLQHEIWRQFLMEGVPPQQEKIGDRRDQAGRG